MLTVSEALQTILERAEPLLPVRVPLLESLGQVLAQDVLADRDSPPFDNSAVDGFAVLSADTASATAVSPIELKLVAEVPAGAPWDGCLESGSTVKIMTGAPIPHGSDAVVMREDTWEESDRIVILQAVRNGDHVRFQGEDIHSGARVLAAGTIISPSEIGVLAAFGVARPVCFARPRVAVFSTGDELVSIESTPGPGQIRDSNRAMLEALVREAGGKVVWSQHLPDDMEATRTALRDASNGEREIYSDVIVTSGGVSVGDRDFIKPVVEELGQLTLWRVAMKPGKPLAYGKVGQSIFVGLPGNPVSTLVTFELFVRPLLLKLAGRKHTSRPRVLARLTAQVDHSPGREEYVRVRLIWDEDGWSAEPMGHQGSNRFRSILGWNGLAILDASLCSFTAGSLVPCMVTALPECEH